VPKKADSNVLECLLDKGFVAFVTNVADVEKGSIFAAPVRMGQMLLPHHVQDHPDPERDSISASKVMPRQVLVQADPAKVVALRPTDFHGLVPKVLVKPGDRVKAGTPLFCDKYNERVLYTSPVSGEVAEVVRGEKSASVLEVRVLADAQHPVRTSVQAMHPP
jgi:biotin carboxyl carrier protein